MAAMMLILTIMSQSLLKFISINTIAAISWLPPLISPLFHPEGRITFSQLGCF